MCMPPGMGGGEKKVGEGLLSPLPQVVVGGVVELFFWLKNAPTQRFFITIVHSAFTVGYGGICMEMVDPNVERERLAKLWDAYEIQERELAEAKEKIRVLEQELEEKVTMLDTLKGVITQPQQCRAANAPTSFIWCQLRIAAMPLDQRTKGRAMRGAQKCQPPHALPNQFNGVIYPARKRYRFVAPRGVKEGPQKCRFHVTPTSLTGTLT